MVCNAIKHDVTAGDTLHHNETLGLGSEVSSHARASWYDLVDPGQGCHNHVFAEQVDVNGCEKTIAHMRLHVIVRLVGKTINWT